MNKPVYEVRCDHILLTKQVDTIELNDFVIGIQLRVLSTSGEPNMTYGLNEAAGKVPLTASDLPASYGGFHVDGVPTIYRGELNYAFASNTNPRALLVITRLNPVPVPDLEIC